MSTEVRVELMEKFVVAASPFCEHCGDLDKGVPTINEGNTSYCIDCAEQEYDLTPEEVSYVESKRITYTPSTLKLFTWWDYGSSYDDSIEQYLVVAETIDQAYEFLLVHLRKEYGDKRVASRLLKGIKKRFERREQLLVAGVVNIYD